MFKAGLHRDRRNVINFQIEFRLKKLSFSQKTWKQTSQREESQKKPKAWTERLKTDQKQTRVRNRGI